MTGTPINLRSLDMLRGLLAVYVLLGHCRWLLWTGHAAWMAGPHPAWLEPLVYASGSLRFGREAVMVFFVLSGFFIHLRVAQQPVPANAAVSTRDFFRRRVHRLGAPYVFALVVTLVCDAIGRSWFPTLYAAATGDGLIDGVFSHAGYGARSVVPALVVLPSSLGEDFGTNGPLWSLAYEVVYYALYPAWFALRRVSAVGAFAIVPIACLMLALTTFQPFLVTVIIRYPVWLAGAGLAELLSQFRGRRLPFVVSTLVFAAGLALHLFGGSDLSSAVAALIFGSAAVYAFATLGSGVETWFGRAFEYLGARSYSIYITHFPFVALMSAMLFQINGQRPTHGWFAVAGGAAAVGFGCLCFELCERHFVHHRVPTARLAA